MFGTGFAYIASEDKDELFNARLDRFLHARRQGDGRAVHPGKRIVESHRHEVERIAYSSNNRTFRGP